MFCDRKVRIVVTEQQKKGGMVATTCSPKKTHAKRTDYEGIVNDVDSVKKDETNFVRTDTRRNIFCSSSLAHWFNQQQKKRMRHRI
jgi:hypothetical protein